MYLDPKRMQSAIINCWREYEPDLAFILFNIILIIGIIELSLILYKRVSLCMKNIRNEDYIPFLYVFIHNYIWKNLYQCFTIISLLSWVSFRMAN